MRKTGCALLLLCAGTAAAAGSAGERRTGDALRYLLPVGVLAAEGLRGDFEGARQFGLSFAATTVVTELLKRTTGVERPDGTNDRSFPSGHAASAFAAATYVHRRHGLEAAVPVYALATYVGYTRVHSGRHRWIDVGGAAAIAAASTWTFVDAAPVSVSVGHRQVAVRWSMPLR